MFDPRFSFDDLFEDHDGSDSAVCRERHVYDVYGTGEHRPGQWRRRFEVEDLEAAARLAYRFQGHRQDTETPLVSFQLRSFHPKSEPWMSQEPLRYVDGMNAYVFSRGDPVKPVKPA